MTQNPATELYKAWDGLFRLRMQPHHLSYFRQQLRGVDPSEPSWLDGVPYGDRSYYGLDQMIDWHTVVKPTAMLPDGRLFYTMGFHRGGSFQPLFQLSPRGHFRVGTTFAGFTTRGSYERVSTHTFLKGDRTYDHTYRSWAWWVRGYDSDQRWLRTRDWRAHTYYWRAQNIAPSTWYDLTRIGKTWRAGIAKPQGDREYLVNILSRQYQQAEDYYAKWRRKYHRDHGIPDPEKALDHSDIETVEYLAQHLRVYDPPKARMPS